MCLQSSLQPYLYIESLARHPVKTLTEAIVRAQEEIRVENMYIRKGQQLDRRNKIIETRAIAQAKIAQPKYERGTTATPKERVLAARTEPHQNQREVFLALQASGNLPKPKSMKSTTAEV